MIAPETMNEGDRWGLVGTKVADKFVIERFVAEGGFGVVYRGLHESLDRPVAVKVLKVPTDLSVDARAKFMARFNDEAKTVARIDHPNIVRVLDYGVTTLPNGETAPYTALEWLEGETVESLLKSRAGQPMRPDEVLALLRPAFEAVAYAHDEGIAHRDIKPANMMLVRGKRDTTLRMLDFGIAKKMVDEEQPAAASGMTSTRGANAGYSPQYAAPEQVTGTRTGPWTDVHALALVVTEALIGRPAYAVGDLTELFADILGEPRPTPARHKVGVGAWEPVLGRALALRPSERYQDARTFLSALENDFAGAKAGSIVPPAPMPMGNASSSMPSPLVSPVTGAGFGSMQGQASMTAPPVETQRPEPAKRSPAVYVAAVATVLAVAMGGGWAATHYRHTGNGADNGNVAVQPVAPVRPTPTPAVQPAPPMQPTMPAPQPTVTMVALDGGEVGHSITAIDVPPGESHAPRSGRSSRSRRRRRDDEAIPVE